MRRRSLFLLAPAAILLAGCGSSKPAPVPPGQCTPGIVLGKPAGHQIVCPPFTVGWVPAGWVVSRQPGVLFAAAPAGHQIVCPPFTVGWVPAGWVVSRQPGVLFAAGLGGTYKTLAALRASVGPQLSRLFKKHVREVVYSTTRLQAGPALVVAKPASGRSPAVTVYLLLHEGFGYELEFETSNTPTGAVAGTIGRIAHSLRFDGGVAPARYDVDFTLTGDATVHPGADGSSIQVAFRELRFSNRKWHLDVAVTNTSPGLLTFQFGLVLVRYRDASSVAVEAPKAQVRLATAYDPPLPRAGLEPGKTWHGTAVGADSSRFGPAARPGIGYRTIVPATSTQRNVVSIDVVLHPAAR
jgi:hypothetical protein